MNKKYIDHTRERYIAQRNPEYCFVNYMDKSYYIVDFLIEQVESLRKESDVLYTQYNYQLTQAAVYMRQHNMAYIDKKEEIQGNHRGRAQEYEVMMFIAAMLSMGVTEAELIDRINSILSDCDKFDGFSYVKDGKLGKKSELDIKIYREVLNGEVLVSSCILAVLHAIIKESIIYGKHTEECVE